MSSEYFKTQILLLHPQQSTLDVFSSGFNEKYAVHVATSGTEALSTLVATPIDVIVTAQELGGMSGLDAIREAKKRSPDTIGILLVGDDDDDDIEAMVGDQEVFQIVRGSISPTELRNLIDTATRRARLLALSESANDQAANPDEPVHEHIVMETSENGSTIISDGTGRMPALKPEKVALMANAGGNEVDILVLTKDDEFLATIRDSARGLHNVHHANTPTKAEGLLKGNKVGVLVTDAAMIGSNIEVITQGLRKAVPRLVAVVAGRRDDGDLLMDLINRGHVYRFLLKPVSPGRARLAIEASVKHHLEAGDSAFKCKPKAATRHPPARKAAAKPATSKKPKMTARAMPKAKPQARPKAKPQARPKAKPPAKARQTRAPQPRPASTVITASPQADRLSDPFDQEGGFGETMTGIAGSVGKSLAGASGFITGGAKTVLKSSGSGLVKLLAAIVAPLIRPKNLAIVGGLLAIAGGGYWVTNNWQSLLPQSQPDSNSGMPVIVESDVPSAGSQTPVVSAVDDLLDQARSARGSGYIYSPAGANAVEFYLAAMSLEPDDPIIAAELEDVVDQTLGMIEKALLQQRTDDAAEALQMVRLADPDNSRLVFLDTQVRQMQLRSALDQARAAIRSGRFEDAGNLISTAENVNTGDVTEIDTLKQELAASRSEQEVDEVLGLANDRLNDNKLITPSNDNARYYYELALSNDPDNRAARQGMTIVASKLVLQARQAIDKKQFALASSLLDDAKALDPASGDLVASKAALNDARNKQAAEQQVAAERRADADRLEQAERRAEAERIAARERQAELEREFEVQRQAEAKKRAELERQLKAQVETEAQKRAELERQLAARSETEAEKRAELERQLEAQRVAEANKRAEMKRQLDAQRRADADKRAALERELNARKAEDQKQASAELAAAAVAAAKARSSAARNDPAPVSTSHARKIAGSNKPQFDPSPEYAEPLAATMNQLPVERLSPQVERTFVPEPSNTSGDARYTGNSFATPGEPGQIAMSQLRRTNYVAPEYPRSAERRNTSGWVDLGFTVGRDGNVHSIEIIESAPGKVFVDAATKAVSQWRFEPVVENGQPVEKRAAVRMSFSLE